MRRLTAFRAGRLVEAFAWGQDFKELARRFRISQARAEDVVRRAEKRGRRRT